MTTEVSSRVTKSTAESASLGLKRTSCEDPGMSGPLAGGTGFIIVRLRGDDLELIHNLMDFKDVCIFVFKFLHLLRECEKRKWMCVITLTTMTENPKQI